MRAHHFRTTKELFGHMLTGATGRYRAGSLLLANRVLYRTYRDTTRGPKELARLSFRPDMTGPYNTLLLVGPRCAGKTYNSIRLELGRGSAERGMAQVPDILGNNHARNVEWLRRAVRRQITRLTQLRVTTRVSWYTNLLERYQAQYTLYCRHFSLLWEDVVTDQDRALMTSAVIARRLRGESS